MIIREDFDDWRDRDDHFRRRSAAWWYHGNRARKWTKRKRWALMLLKRCRQKVARDPAYTIKQDAEAAIILIHAWIYVYRTFDV